MITPQTRVGVWGFGITGKSVARFLSSRIAHVDIMDKNPPTHAAVRDAGVSGGASIAVHDESDIHAFFARNDIIIPTPSIDIRQLYQQYKHKFLSEVDLFYTHAYRPIIAITGTVGKSTVTSFFTHLLRAHGKSVLMGGNIGIGMLDLIEQQEQADYLVLEAADVQLKYAQQFCPDIAILTNFSANHLDWHDNIDDYFKAKSNIFAHQQKHQHAIVPIALAEHIKRIHDTAATFHYLHTESPSIMQQQALRDGEHIFYTNDQCVYACTRTQRTQLITRAQLPPSTYVDNWITIIATLHVMGIGFEKLIPAATGILALDHRLQVVATINGVTYINDSKSTTVESTIAAVQSLRTTNIHLLLGGLSKGVDRAPLITFLSGRVKHLYCFGTQAEQLYQLCKNAHIPATQHATLEETFAYAAHAARCGDYVLLSPAGSSWDQFKDYKERGTLFKQLVQHHQAQVSASEQGAVHVSTS